MIPNTFSSAAQKLDPKVLSFLNVMLPSAGLRCMAIPQQTQDGRGYFKHVWGETNDWLANVTQLADQQRGLNVYYALGGYDPEGSRDKFGRLQRVATNVVAIRVLCLDIDVGRDKSYPTQDAAIEATGAFVGAAGLPSPWFVSSGCGIHVYWPVDKDMDPAEWRALATALKIACRVHGLRADPSRTSDIASVLRPPGTHHRKDEPKPVEVLIEGEVAELDTIRTALRPYTEPEPANDDLGPRPAYVTEVDNSDLTGGVEQRSSSAEKAATKCGVLALLRDSRGNVDQPTWYFSLGVMAFQTDGAKLAHEWSSGHRDYTHAETEAKLMQAAAVGHPTSCAKLSDYQPTICAACPYNGKVKTPWSLGIEDDADAELVEASPVESLGYDLADALANRPPPARNWLLGETVLAGHYTVIQAAGAAGKTSIMIALLVGAALGRSDIAGCDVDGPKKVALILGEDFGDEFHRRASALLKRHHVSLSDLRGRLTIIPSMGLKLTRAVGGRFSLNPAAVARLGEILDREQADILAVDPLFDILGDGFNDNASLVDAASAIIGLLEPRNAGALLIHHVGKAAMRAGATGSAEAGLGGIMLVNKARICLSVNKLDPKNALELGVHPGDAWRHNYLGPAKINVTANQSDRHFRFETEVLSNGPGGTPGDEMPVAVPFHPTAAAAGYPDAAYKAAVTAIAIGCHDGPYSLNSRSTDRSIKGVIENAIGPFLDGDTKHRALDAKEVLKRLLDLGWIVEGDVHVRRTDGKGGKRVKRGVVARWANTPWSAEPCPGDCTRLANEPPPTTAMSGEAAEVADPADDT